MVGSVIIRLARRAIPLWMWDRLRPRYNRLRRAFADRFLAHGPQELVEAFRGLGIEAGDVVMMHAAYTPYTGFRGSPKDIIDALLEAVGKTGTLLMPSLPYDGATSDYLRSDAVFDVQQTPSRMGLLTEVFRRRRGVLRSLSPSHPLLAYGAQAEALTAGHERCVQPCGAGSPFERLAERNAKFLFLSVGPNVMTFVHYLEDRASPHLPFELYELEPTPVTVKAPGGRELGIEVQAFSRTAVETRNVEHLLHQLRASGSIVSRRVGGTRLRLVSAADAIAAADAVLQQRDQFIFDLPK